MKRIVQILFIAILIAFVIGYYFKWQEDHVTGDKIVGIAVIVSAFVFIPLFIYSRSKGKNIQDYMMTKENLDKMNDKKGENTENQ
ncbi:hypothetical protein [Galbibacter mesophilus]|uniref:hypothetical protein n=1 Tax=Galbibacter mesophilus TaxID=379069 RepID=UPI00192038EF|nr:hypothetical protein [Galbibacter mesophilus]MCM5662415.1 hypothetical protein [Galbibacter mesophilus]